MQIVAHGVWVISRIIALYHSGSFFSNPYIPLRIREAGTRFSTSRSRKILTSNNELFHGFGLTWQKRSSIKPSLVKREHMCYYTPTKDT